MHRSLLAVLAVALMSIPTADAANVGTSLKKEVKRYAHDARSMAVAPLHWDQRQWLRFGAGVGAVAVVFAEDRPIYDAIQRARGRTTNDIARVSTPWGSSRAEWAAEALILAGAGFGNTNVRDAGRDAIESQIMASGVITPALKFAFGRARPFQELGTHHFFGFTTAYQSFPSGHATNAFATATAISQHFDNWIVPTISYTLATAIAFSRINDQKHFPSDVLAGALIGRAVAKGVYYRHKNVTVTPAMIDRHPAIAIHIALQ